MHCHYREIGQPQHIQAYFVFGFFYEVRCRRKESASRSPGESLSSMIYWSKLQQNQLYENCRSSSQFRNQKTEAMTYLAGTEKAVVNQSIILFWRRVPVRHESASHEKLFLLFSHRARKFRDALCALFCAAPFSIAFSWLFHKRVLILLSASLQIYH